MAGDANFSFTFGFLIIPLNLSFFIARRYLAKQKGTFSSFIIRLAIVATALSVTVMIVAMAVVNGFGSAITEKLYSFMGHVHVVPYSASRSNTPTYSESVYNDPKLVAAMRRVPHVVAVSAFTERFVIVQANGNMEGLQLKGVGKDYHYLKGMAVSGKGIDYSDTSYAKEVILSQTTADRLNVAAGDMVQLDFIQDGLPRIRRVRVCGIYHTGLEDMDGHFGLCDTRLLQRINNWGADSINGYQVDLDNVAYADTVSAYLHYHVVQAPLEAYTTAEIYSNIFDWLRLTGMNGIILLIIMTVVAAINMGAVLVILMVDRAPMIGLLKALGMPFAATRNIFLSIAGLVAGAGILAGNILGLTMCWLQVRFGFIRLPEQAYFMKYAPIKVIWWQLAATDAGALVLCIVCMWLPALYIRRIQPAKVLQFK
jgi:lipoprotein-releasing system permease protein